MKFTEVEELTTPLIISESEARCDCNDQRLLRAPEATSSGVSTRTYSAASETEVLVITSVTTVEFLVNLPASSDPSLKKFIASLLQRLFPSHTFFEIL